MKERQTAMDSTSRSLLESFERDLALKRDLATYRKPATRESADTVTKAAFCRIIDQWFEFTSELPNEVVIIPFAQYAATSEQHQLFLSWLMRQSGHLKFSGPNARAVWLARTLAAFHKGAPLPDLSKIHLETVADALPNIAA